MDSKDLPVNIRDDKISEETKKLISSLPSYTVSQGQKICQYQGCWYYYNTLQGVLNFQRGFQPQDTDIILASFPKSGPALTTWLKALTVALLERSKNHSSSDADHPLLYDNPHGIVPCLEIDVYRESSNPNLAKFSASPRLLSTHMPLQAMHENLKHSSCKIVYVCRNLKDTLISSWFFVSAIHKIEPNRSFLESIFKSFCNGTNYYGPVWEHILGYWRRSLEDPKHVLFMRYEEMKAEPRDQIKKLANFLGCPLTKQEEESGFVDEILDLCSLRNLSSLEVNQTGKINNVDHKFYFRKGEVGDSKNYLTPEMDNKIDMIIQEKLQGSGLMF
ncbi:Cytosolic sulfotransferase 1 [Raphanus sativus]|uniref:Sulfotransferase n=1 Tax=Raphanus sativus TaxID=3726 RepID=A0A6J0NIY1_RAPSA|nr:cytosolic sulfotransferase 5-like [Raphanus sativus]KAJ4904928.1 Cytosolic sulfotransferase 1 [Raphanus sativus]